MAEESGTGVDQLATIPYEVIRDKTLNTHDHLFKLIIIGDSCKYGCAILSLTFRNWLQLWARAVCCLG